jgi:tetratricopeptide (TPR) repeat protein
MLFLERARDLIEEGRPQLAAALLRRPAPALFRVERDFLMAEALRAQGFFSKAEVLYRGVLRSGELWAEAAAGLTSILRSLGRSSEARSLWNKARSRTPRQSWLLEDALIDRSAGLYPRALKKLASLKPADDAERAFILWATGGARRFHGDLKGSHRDFVESLRRAKRAGDPQGQAYALFGLGGVLRILGRFAEAEKAYAEAGRRLAGTPDIFGRAYAHCGLANVLRQRGKLEEAARNYVKSHALYTQLGDWVDLAYVDWGLGQIHLKKGELPRAEARFKRALKGFGWGAEQRGLAMTEKSLAEVLHATGRTARAEALFDRAVARARKAGLHAHLEIFT